MTGVKRERIIYYQVAHGWWEFGPDDFNFKLRYWLSMEDKAKTTNYICIYSSRAKTKGTAEATAITAIFSEFN